MINSIRNTVFFLLNKDNKGYISPLEFNSFAKMAQLEVFEEYFGDFARQTQLQNLRKRSLGFGDMAEQVANKISTFATSSTLAYTDVDATNSNPAATNPGGAEDYFSHPNNYYKLINLTYGGRLLQEVNKMNFDLIINSNLSKPSVRFPIFYREDSRIYARPLSILYTSTTPQGVETPLIMNYIRKPLDPVWGYVTVGGNPVYNAASTTNFEVSAEDEVNLIIKICKHAGLAIREVDVVSAMSNEEQVDLQINNS